MQYDLDSCRLSCKSVEGSEFYNWVSQDYHDQRDHYTCWCKSSDSGRGHSVGVISGNVNCVKATGKLIKSNCGL